MQRTFRLKLFAMVGAAALGLIVILVAGALIERRADRYVSAIREQYIPKIGLADQLQTAFERISRRLLDAAQANDVEMVEDAHRQETALLDQIAAAHDSITPSAAASARTAIEDYYKSAEAVTRRLIRGETGENLGHDVEAMQSKQAQAAQRINEAGHFDEKGLTDAFAATAAAQETGAQLRLAISLACLALVLFLSLWISRGMYRSLADLAAGFRRFGDGQFATPIPATRNDELGSVARDANQMADRLRKLNDDRDRNDWLKAGQVGLAGELRGEMEPEEVGDRGVRFLAGYLGAPVAVLYYKDPDGALRPLGRCGVADARLPESFAIGEGVIGEAARLTEVTVITAPKGHLPMRSALTDGDPRAIVFIPLVHSGAVIGVVELGVLADWTPQNTEFVLSVRDSLTIAIEVARGRAATRSLLAETQRQAAELLAARRGLEQKADELARASSYKSQFLANMSHELRTPLNAILGFSELIYDGTVPADSPQHKEFIGDILTSGRHLLQLINDVLDLSKVEAGKLEFYPERIQLTRTAKEVLSILRTAAATARIRIQSTIDPSVDELVVDPSRLKQVLYNYLSNAIKFTPENGTVTLRATAEGKDNVRIEVEDSGIGISPEGLARLFGEFQQITGDGKKRGGTGLGLALTKRLVEAQGGSVGVRSVVGQGSTFHAILPRNTVSKPVPAITPPIQLTGGPSILVIEDDARDQRDLIAALSGAGYSVEVCGSGAQALARCRERSFDAITLDLLLPDMSGLEVLRGIRMTEQNRDVPVVVLTVVAEHGSVAGFAVHDILSKPLDPDVLVKSLARCGVPSRTGTVMVVDDDPVSLKLMSTTLQQLGYQTQCLSDAEQALRTAREAWPAAIVLDLLMPGMSGFEFLDHLRRDEAGRRVPVLVWTSKDLSIDEKTMLRASANAVVSKGSQGSATVLAELASRLLGHKDEENAG
jgi:signal transduction histidine kinase/CheY-like chemotaxis protein